MIRYLRGAAKYPQGVRGTRAKNITIPRDLHDAVVAVGAERGVTFSDVIVAALDAYLPHVSRWEPRRLPTTLEVVR